MMNYELRIEEGDWMAEGKVGGVALGARGAMWGVHKFCELGTSVALVLVKIRCRTGVRLMGAAPECSRQRYNKMARHKSDGPEELDGLGTMPAVFMDGMDFMDAMDFMDRITVCESSSSPISRLRLQFLQGSDPICNEVCEQCG